MPALPLHGRSLMNGVRFSVQTGSRGNVPWRRCSLGRRERGWSPDGVNDMTGRIVRVESTKLSDAQKRPDSAFVREDQRSSALKIVCQIKPFVSRCCPSVHLRHYPKGKVHTLHRRLPQPKPTVQHQFLQLCAHSPAPYPTILRPTCLA